MTSVEMLVNIEDVRTSKLRASYGELSTLGSSIKSEGLRHPITLWSDGTLISGNRRHRAHLLAGAGRIKAVFVDTIEDAAKRLLADNEDDHCALPWKPSELCHLWELLHLLDAPAARKRAEEARRRGVALRRLTQAGKRAPGRTHSRSKDHVLHLVAPAFGLSETTAWRLWGIYNMAYGLDMHPEATDDQRSAAREALASIDAGDSTIWANYQSLISSAPVPPPTRRPAPVTASAEAARQLSAWDRSLPQLEGIVTGLAELGPPNPDLTWDQVGPVHTRLMVVRRSLEVMIKKMRETQPS